MATHPPILGLPTSLFQVADLAEIDTLDLPAPHFGCLIACDSTDRSVNDIANAATVLLNAGCVYFCCWGHGCERFHDIVDEMAVHLDLESKRERTIMTTWHASDSLARATWYLLNCAVPDAAFEDDYRSLIAISAGPIAWVREIEAVLRGNSGHA